MSRPAAAPVDSAPRNLRDRFVETRAIVDLGAFVEATRDSGYRGISAAIAEFVDNSIEAAASDIKVEVRPSPDSLPEVFVADNGTGMSSAELVRSLQFGGSSRFRSREGLGRYGMGLPNAALSLAQRIDVYSWQSRRRPLRVHLDLDQVAGSDAAVIGPPAPSSLPRGFEKGRSGTLLHLTKCDRIQGTSNSQNVRGLHWDLGRRFRYFLWKGVKIAVNGEPVRPVDPLFLRGPSRGARGSRFGEPLRYEIRSEPSDPSSPVGTVEVVFAELPVDAYFDLPNAKKRRLGISGGAGVSIVRAGREVDYGWFFMGSKRKENYDDWWRAEIRFEPILDESFGITHTKQEIYPTDSLKQILAPDCEVIARALNARVRVAHARSKRRSSFLPAEEVAARTEPRLPPIPEVTSSGQQSVRHSTAKANTREGVSYRIVEGSAASDSFYRCEVSSNLLTLELNEHHPFAQRLLSSLDSGENGRGLIDPMQVELLLLAAARAELMLSSKDRKVLACFRRAWSDILAAFLSEGGE